MFATNRYTAMPVKRIGARTRGELLDALEVALGSVGWREMRVRDITDPIGVTQSAFYQYWKNPTVAFRELMEVRTAQGQPVSAHLILINTLVAHEDQM